MKKVRWMVFFAVVIIGSGAILSNIDAVGPDDGKDKMETAKRILLASDSKTMNIDNCEISANAFKSLHEDKEDIILNLCLKNPTKDKKQLTIPLLVDSTISDMMSRVMPRPKAVLNQQIQVSVPAKGSIEKEIVIATKNISGDEKSGIKRDAVYQVYITQMADNKETRTLICAFSSSAVPESKVIKPPESVTVLKK